MEIAKLLVLAFFGVALVVVSAYMHVNGQDGSGWGMAAAITWVAVLFSAWY